MARKSARRRLLAKQGKLAASLKMLRSAASDTDNAMLQRGSPRNTSQAKFDRVASKVTPLRPTNWESKGMPKNFTKEPRRATVGTKAADRASIPALVSEYLMRGGKIS